jgi:uncharacterized protein YbjT (DUF2867 family)
MKKILITGATGNIGEAVIKWLFKQDTEHQVIAAVRDINRAKEQLSDYPKLDYRIFDFEQAYTFSDALKGIDALFLLRPPHISDVQKYIEPLIKETVAAHIRQVMFLSVQGAEKSKIIPHHKIENLITAEDLDYIFLRPSYFMQNLTTTLGEDIQNRNKIILPAGDAVFNWVDVENIGEAAAVLFDRFDEYKNQALEITGYENKNFQYVANLISDITDKNIVYVNKNPVSYYLMKRKQNVSRGMIMVMIMLHFLPRFQSKPDISTAYEDLTGKKPTTLKEFIKREM